MKWIKSNSGEMFLREDNEALKEGENVFYESAPMIIGESKLGHNPTPRDERGYEYKPATKLKEDKLKTGWHEPHVAAVKHRKKCAKCGKLFVPKNARSIYCSERCKKAVQYVNRKARLKEKEEKNE